MWRSYWHICKMGADESAQMQTWKWKGPAACLDLWVNLGYSSFLVQEPFSVVYICSDQYLKLLFGIGRSLKTDSKVYCVHGWMMTIMVCVYARVCVCVCVCVCVREKVNGLMCGWLCSIFLLSGKMFLHFHLMSDSNAVAVVYIKNIEHSFSALECSVTPKSMCVCVCACAIGPALGGKKEKKKANRTTRL